ncbi:MAG TPA: hypothetical protein VFB26_10315 [Gaiellaceae bacterium]|nr:hypothetical protein [Gaiellaceae bacterium]
MTGTERARALELAGSEAVAACSQEGGARVERRRNGVAGRVEAP